MSTCIFTDGQAGAQLQFINVANPVGRSNAPLATPPQPSSSKAANAKWAKQACETMPVKETENDLYWETLVSLIKVLYLVPSSSLNLNRMTGVTAAISQSTRMKVNMPNSREQKDGQHLPLRWQVEGPALMSLYTCSTRHCRPIC